MLVTPAPIRLLQVLACTRFQGNSCRRYSAMALTVMMMTMIMNMMMMMTMMMMLVMVIMMIHSFKKVNTFAVSAFL